MFIRRESFKQFIQLYPITSAILLINLIMFTLIKLPFIPHSIIIENLIGINLYIKEGELWRLVTPLFLHNSPGHFIFNSFALLLFGPAVEQMLTHVRFLLLYSISGIGANILTYLFYPLTYAHLGASGAIFGLIGFYLYLTVFQSHLLSRQDAQMIKIMSLFALIMTFLQTNVNIVAHLGGCTIGFLLSFLLYKYH